MVETPKDLTSSASGFPQEVCRSLEVDLTGQTSASYNMRLNYEKCLLEFEVYLASGQYAQDLAAGTAPSPDAITHQNTKIVVMPGIRGVAGEGVEIPAAVAPMTMTTRSARCVCGSEVCVWEGGGGRMVCVCV